MTLVQGELRLVTDTPDEVSQVWVQAPKERLHGTGMVTTGRASEQVTNGAVSFNALPGAAVMVLLVNGIPSLTVKLLIPNKANATLRECIEAVGLADDGALSELEELALEVARIAAQIASADQLETWASETALAAAQAQDSKDEANDAASRAGVHESGAEQAESNAKQHELNAKQAESNAKQAESNADAAAGRASSAVDDASDELQGYVGSAEDSAYSAADSAAEAKTAETNAKAHEISAASSADRAEFAAEETIQQIEGDFATRNYVDEAKWYRGNAGLSSTLDDLEGGSWGIAGGSVAEALGLPRVSTGTLIISRMNSGAGRTAIFVTSTHTRDSPDVWVNATANSGGWGDWVDLSAGFAPSTKQAAVPLTFPRGSSYSDSRETLTIRIPFKFGAAVKRARLRLRNYDYRSDHGFPGSYRIVGAGIGKHQINPDGSMTGLIPEGESITQLMSSTSMTGPDEAAGDWVDVDLEPNTDYLLSYSFTADDGMVYTRQTAQCFTNRLSSGWNRTGTTTATPSNMAVLAAILDVEVAEDTPIYGYLGDSQTAAISASRPGYDSWAMVHSRLSGAIPTIHGHAGGGLNEWQDSAKPAYSISDGMARFDRFHISMGSNDISGGRPFTGVQQYLTTVMQNWRNQTDTFVLHNYLPRTSDNPTDNVRDALNDWILDDLPGNALYTVDVWNTTVDPSTGLMSERWRGSPTDVHMSSAGNARVAMATFGGVMREPVGGVLAAYNQGKGL